MNLRTTLGLLVAALVATLLVGYATEGRFGEFQSFRGRPFSGLRQEFFVGITIDRAGQRLRVERRGDRWRLLEPIDFPAAAEGVDRLIRLLRSLSLRGEAGSPRAEHGFDEVRLTVSFTDGHGRTRSVRFGGDAPIEGLSACFLCWESEVYLCDRSHRDAFRDLRVNNLRDRAVCPISPGRSTELTIHGREHTPLVFRREEKTWRLASTPGLRIDDAEVVHMLAVLAAWEIEEFVPAVNGSTSARGLSPARYTVTVRSESGDVCALRIGNRASEGRVFLAREGEVELFEVSRAPLELFDRSADSYRDRGLLVTRESRFRSLEVQGERDVRVEFAGESRASMRVGRSGPRFPVAGSWLLDRLDALHEPRIREFLPRDGRAQEYGFFEPTVTLTVVPLEGDPETVVVGHRAPGRGEWDYLVTNSLWSDQHAIASLPEIEWLLRVPFSLRSDELLPVSLGEVKHIILRAAGGPRESFVRPIHSWHRELPNGEKRRMDEGDMARVLRLLQLLRPARWELAGDDSPTRQTCELAIEVHPLRGSIEFDPVVLFIGFSPAESPDERPIRVGDGEWSFRARTSDPASQRDVVEQVLQWLHELRGGG